MKLLLSRTTQFLPIPFKFNEFTTWWSTCYFTHESIKSPFIQNSCSQSPQFASKRIVPLVLHDFFNTKGRRSNGSKRQQDNKENYHYNLWRICAHFFASFRAIISTIPSGPSNAPMVNDITFACESESSNPWIATQIPPHKTTNPRYADKYAIKSESMFFSFISTWCRVIRHPRRSLRRGTAYSPSDGDQAITVQAVVLSR